jgi:hypothetical protein
MKEVGNALPNQAGKMMSLHTKPSLAQVPSILLIKDLAGSFCSSHSTSVPSEPTVQLAQMANLLPKDPRGFSSFLYLIHTAPPL